MKIVISKVTAPRLCGEDDVYFSAFDADTGEKIAPETDSDTPEQVQALLAELALRALKGNNNVL